jgi:hypothetical protein
VQQDGSWSCTPSSALPDGTTTLTATQDDGAGNSSPQSAPVTFTVAGGTCTAAPFSTSVSPTRGPIGGGTPVTITGGGYVQVQQVEFGDTDVSDFQVLDSSHIATSSPAHAVGTVEIKITTPCGVDPIYFTYYDPSADLAGTGQDLSRGGLMAGLAALLAGIGAVIVARRKRMS